MPRNNSRVRREKRRIEAKQRQPIVLGPAERLLAIYGKTPEEAIQEGMFRQQNE